MKHLNEILQGIRPIKVFGENDILINNIVFDSRKVEKGDLFVAVKGTQSDGHDFIDKVISSGAIAIICETLPEKLNGNVCYIQVKDSSDALGRAASDFYGNPSAKLKLVGVTGTNGKTTTATTLYRLFLALGYKAGLFSTVRNYINGKTIDATHTTPDPVQLNRIMMQMIDEGCEFCFMEVSSHAIVQNRISGLTFTGGIFTNITHDHLDYHKTFSEYLRAKKLFFDNLSANAFALTNADDRNGLVMLQNTKAIQKTYSLQTLSDFRLRIIESDFSGMLLNYNGIDVSTLFVGRFNAYNILAVISAAELLGQKVDEILMVISTLRAVDGRFETYRAKNDITAIVDYAHTPDALENVINTINSIRNNEGTLITVVGAGGNRDKTKRPVMAKVCCEKSNKVIITSDNPRNEKPEDIIADMLGGLDASDKRKVITITDRSEAIKTACMMAQQGDIILVAGKGHETYQEVNGVKHHFDDREKIKEYLEIQ